MSVMGGAENVNVDFNIGGNYGATMGQMLAQAEQYAKSTDTMIGNIGRLNAATVALIGRTTALTGANKIATQEAAAYQQRLQNIEATARTTGQSFAQLEKTTLGLARTMPGGIGEAARYVETLQKSGITAEKQIGKLAEAMHNLGEANGLDGAELGKQLLTVNRMFGNSTDSLEKFGDTLTTLSAKFGASADGSLAFAKALSPVAAAVGMSETAVLGLGTAASRLGEDGYASANAFNRVLLDMQKSIRDGSPEIKEYAGLLNMSATALGQLFRDDPTEVLVKFTEAVGKGGSQVSRTLDALGLDSVRTVKSIQALSSQGNLRQIIEEATGAYGNGASAKAAETALSGVNNQVAMLSETLSQTVAAAGKPFLGWLSDVLKMANAASGAVASLMQSAPVQAVGKVAAPMAMVGQIASTALTVGVLGSMGGQALRFGRNQLGQFRGAMDMTRSGDAMRYAAMGYPEMMGEGMAARAGARVGEAMPAPLFLPAGQGGGGLRGLLSAGYRATVNTAGAFGQMNMNTMLNAPWMADSRLAGLAGRSAEAQRFAQEMSVFSSPGSYRGMEGMTRVEQLKGIESTVERGIRTGLLKEGTTASSLGKVLGQYGVAGATTGAAAWQGLRAAAPIMTNPYVLAGAGVAAAGYGAYKIATANSDAMEQTDTGWSDAYSKFNDFAAAAGEASKGLLTFSDALSATAGSLAKQNKTINEALTVSSSELAAASTGGYQRAFTATGEDAKTQALSARLMLGTTPTSSQLGRVSNDLVNQYGLTSAQDVINELKKTQGVDQLSLVKPALEAWSQNQGWMGPNQTGVDMLGGLKSLQTQYTSQVASTYGDKASFMGGLAVPITAMNAASEANDPAQARGAYDVLAKSLGVDYSKLMLAGRRGDKQMTVQELMGQNWEPFTDQAGGAVPETDAFRAKMKSAQEQWRKAVAAGWDPEHPDDFSKVSSTPEEQQRLALRMNMTGSPGSPVRTSYTGSGMQRLPDTSAQTGWSMGGLLYGADIRAREVGVAGPSKLTDDQMGSMTDAAKAMAKYAQDASPANLLKASALTAAEVVARTGGGRAAETALTTAMSGMAPESNAYKIASAALGQVQMGSAAERVGESFGTRTTADIAEGKAALKLMQENPDSADDPALKARVENMQKALGEQVAQMRAFNIASKNLDIQLERQAQDAATTRARSNRDYNLQITAANEDFHKQQYRATRDFNKQMARAEEDYHVARFRATRDFNKSLKRENEDAAKSIYDPYKRIQAVSVWDARSLVANVGEQNQAIRQQIANVKKAKAMGLSQAVIDQLDLTNPANAQQLERIIQDLQANPSEVGGMNRNAAERTRLTRQLTQDPSNKDYRRQLEDFRTSMGDAESDYAKQRRRASADFRTAMNDAATDFATQMRRAATAHSNAMSDMNKDLARSVGRAKRDLLRFNDEVTTDLSSTVETFAANMAKIPDKLRPSMSQNLQALAGAAGTDLKSYLDLINKAYLGPGGTGATITITPTGSGSGPGGPGYSTNPAPMAEGGIGLSPKHVVFGEAGPEALIPLDGPGGKGVKVLAAAFARMLDPGQVRAAQTARYATPVSNYSVHYDQRTQINGPIKVVAQDPNAMARALAAKKRQDNLTAPVGAR